VFVTKPMSTILSHHFNPIDRAVPRTLLMAASTEAAFRSGFLLRDLLDLLQRHLADLVFIWSADPLAMPARASAKSKPARLRNKRERAIAVHRDHDRNNQPFKFFLRRASVELLAELHDIDLRLSSAGPLEAPAWPCPPQSATLPIL